MSQTLLKKKENEAERVISRRAVRVMPFIVLGVFGSGLVMLHRYIDLLRDPFASAFSIQLTLKLCLATGVLVHFLIAVYKIATRTLTVAWSKYIHAAVLVQMLGIVLLAKTMFYIH